MNEITWEVETQTREIEAAIAADAAAEEDFGTRTASVSESRGAEGTPAATASDTAEPGTDDSDENEDDPGTTTVTETVLILNLIFKCRYQNQIKACQIDEGMLLTSYNMSPSAKTSIML